MSDADVFPRITPQHAAAMGYVAYHWALVENRLAFLISTLLNLHYHTGHAVTAELSMLARMNLVHTLIGLSGDTELIEKWRDFESELNALRTERNDIIHGEWQVVGAEHYRLRVKAKQKVVETFVPVSIETLDALSERIAKLADHMIFFAVKFVHLKVPQLITGPNPPGPPPVPARQPRPPSPDRIPRGKRKAARKAALSAQP